MVSPEISNLSFVYYKSDLFYSRLVTAGRFREEKSSGQAQGRIKVAMIVPFLAKLAVFFFLILALLLPHRYLADGSKEKEMTFAMIKPDGISGNYTDSIKKLITESGFTIVEQELTNMDEDTAKNFYAEHSSKSFFQNLVQYMTSGQVMIMILEKQNAVADWRALMGPTDSNVAKITHPHSIRAMCGLDLQRNCVHGSDSRQSADREISLLFKKSSPGLISLHDEL